VEGPWVDGWPDALKYQSIPLFPYIPASYNKIKAFLCFHMTTIRTLLVVAFVQQWSIFQINVKNTLMENWVRGSTCIHLFGTLSLMACFACCIVLFTTSSKLVGTSLLSVVTNAGFNPSDHDPTFFVHTSRRGRMFLLYMARKIIDWLWRGKARVHI